MSDAARNITFDLIDRARTAPASLALILGDRELSYSELNALVWGAVQYLSSKGVRRGDIVALIFSDQLSLLFAQLGVLRMGASTLVFSASHTPYQREEFLANANARFLFTDTTKYMTTKSSSMIFNETCLSNKNEHLDLLCTSPEAYGQIIVGSGSTGKPHLIPLSHHILHHRNKILRFNFDLKPGRRSMNVSPFHFASPISRIFATISAGATCIMWDQRTDIVSAIMSAEPDILNLTVYHAHLILQEAAKRPDFELSRVQIVEIGSSAISEELRNRLKMDLKANLFIIYGTNEAGRITLANPDDVIAAEGGVGRPPPQVTLEVVDSSNNPLCEGEIGEIRIKSPAQIKSYLNGSGADRFSDGWFYPRDLGKWSEHGQLIHMGRADQMMILDGINIYPAEIERVLGNNPAVRDVAAFPLKDKKRQDVPVCAVSLKTGAHADSLELLTYARARLGLRTPRHVLIVEELPRNKQGKLRRPDLERLMAEYVQKKRHRSQTVSRQASALADWSDWPRHHRQCMRVHTLRFEAPRNITLESLDAWRPYFHDATLPCGKLREPAVFPPETALVAAWFEHVLALTRDAFLAVNVPCFEQIHLHKCVPISDETRIYSAVIVLPELENYAPNPFADALRGAISCAYYLQENPPNEAHLESQLREIESKLLEEIRKGVVHSSINFRVLHTAFRAGVPFWHVGTGVYKLGWGASAKLIDRSTSANDSSMSNKLTHLKHVTSRIMRDAGLPAPFHGLVSSLTKARESAEKIGWPVVVKPVDLERGEGVQVDVQPENLESAVKNALELSPKNQVLVERQANGVCHRLFVAGGQLLYAVKRLPIGVYGDGIQTIANLVEAKGAMQRIRPNWLRNKIPPLDDLGRATIASVGLSDTSIPGLGQFVALRRIETTEWGGVDEDVTNLIHPENLRIALVASKLCGLDVAGVDIITDDISKTWVETGAIIDEVNFAPSLGGGEISRRHLPEYIERLMGGNGRIPVEVFVGDQGALDAAKAHASALTGQGTAVFITSDAQTFGPSGQELPLTADGLLARVRALVLTNEVEALAIVIQSDSLFDIRLPLEGVDAVHFVEGPNSSTNLDTNSQKRQQIVKLLSGWVWPQ